MCFYYLTHFFYQDDIVRQHEHDELADNDLIIDTFKPNLNHEIIGRWISIAYTRKFHNHTFLVFDVGVVTDVMKNLVYVDYKTDGGIVSAPLQTKNFNCSIDCIPLQQYEWRMLLKSHQFKETNLKRQRIN